MKQFFKDKKKLLMLSLFVVVTLVACTNPRDPATGNIDPKYLITLDTSFGTMMNLGWFDGLIVWPISQLINLIAGFTDAGISIIIVTMLLQLVTSAFTIKSQVSSQRMQMLQPEMNKIQAKYAGKKDDRSKMMMAQETQALYSKYKINPFGTIIAMFIQFPIILGVYQATQRAEAVVYGEFLGIDLTITPIDGIKAGVPAYIIIFVCMVVAQFLSMKFPQWQQKYKEKHSKVKRKKYAEPAKAGNGMANSMNMMMYFSLAMVAFLAINWPISMSFYWLVSSVARIIQNIVINKFFIKDEA